MYNNYIKVHKLPAEHEEAAQEETAILSAGKQLLDMWFQEQDESARHALHVVFIRHESSKIICKNSVKCQNNL